MLFNRKQGSKSRSKSRPGVVLADPVIEFIDGQVEQAFDQLAAIDGDYATIRVHGWALYQSAALGRLVDEVRRFKVLLILADRPHAANDIRMLVNIELIRRGLRPALRVAEMFGGQR